MVISARRGRVLKQEQDDQDALCNALPVGGIEKERGSEILD